MKEFAIIERFFDVKKHQRKDVIIGIGDDCAVTRVPQGQHLAVTTDTLISGVHFPHDTPAAAIAHKALAVNLSDLAAMGAEPAWYSLSLSMPEANEDWLVEFSQSLFELSKYYSVQLIGGDTVKGPLVITVTAQGFIPQDQALTRSGAKPGDLLYVTGTLGDAGMGLDIVQGRRQVVNHCKDFLINRLNYPSPRLLAGTALRRVATSCIDISDGLLGDLKHVLSASGCGARILVDKLPISIALSESVEHEEALHYALSSGDDYELLFTVDESNKGNLETALSNVNVNATCIGQLTGHKDKIELTLDGEPFCGQDLAYEHFSQ